MIFFHVKWQLIYALEKHTPTYKHWSMYTALGRLGLAIVPLCHGTGAHFDEHIRRPLIIGNITGSLVILPVITSNCKW